MEHPALNRLLAALEQRQQHHAGDRFAGYRVPGLWVDPYGPVAERSLPPEAFFAARIEQILAAPRAVRVAGAGGPGDWGRYAIAYNLFVRAGAAWDHDGDGRVDAAPSPLGWRETGTFLKAITLLPFIRSLGCNTVHLLPITAIGRHGNKGNLGSPFAIRDPYRLDEHLAEPALGLGAEAEFAAFVEAAHHLGLRVVVEFVFRTAARDAAWVAEHPEWFYWIHADVRDRQPGEVSETAYGAPLWTPEELRRIYEQVGTGEYVGLPAPHETYRRMFLPPPDPANVALVDGAWQGVVADPATGAPVLARIPGAFADWTPDSDQPPWSDVTYLRLYDHPDFNYIAYNTVRIVERRLAEAACIVEPLWQQIVEVIPHYQRAFGVDGVMIDMGHALPAALKQRMVARARQVDGDFALWAEDFDLKPGSRAEGVNVCLGPFMQTVRDRASLLTWLTTLSRTGVPLPFMATAENHNVPRAVTWPGGLRYAAYAQTLGALLPGVPYVHGGLEIADDSAINTGFDFTEEQRNALPAERLHLFSAGCYAWTRTPNLVAALRRVHEVRQEYAELLSNPAAESITPCAGGNPLVVAFLRGAPTGLRLIVAGNTDMGGQQAARLYLGGGRESAVELLSGRADPVDARGWVALTLSPGEVVVYALSNSQA